MTTRSTPRVVVTGLGLVTSIGIGRAEFQEASLSGRSGGRALDFPWLVSGPRFTTRIGAPVTGFRASDFEIGEREADLLDPVSQYAIAGTLLALRDAGFTLSEGGSRGRGYRVVGIEPERLAVILGTGIGGLQTIEESHRRWNETPDSVMRRYYLPMLIPNAAAAQVAIRFEAKGECKAVATACASGTMAAGDAFRAIRAGDCDVAIAGGADAILSDRDGYGLKGFDLLRAMSTRNGDPARASRPFDAARDGFVLSEGAGILVLEREEFARARGARVYAEVLGYGTNCDAYHMLMLDPEARSIVRLMTELVRRAGIDPKDVGYINAHGTSTPSNDRTETLAIKRAFGDHAYDLLVSSTKSMTGHSIGAAGGIEAAATALALHTGIVPPTINQETPDPECDLNYVPNRPVERRVDVAISNSFGFGGHNAALLLGRYAGGRGDSGSSGATGGSVE
jgi:3-oxoacyl-[acyl-carrier-protein] synthase II